MRDVSRNTADILELDEIFWRNHTMTKIELLRQYIGDLKSHVPESPGRDNRIAVLEEELEHEQLQNTPSNSDYAKCSQCDFWRGSEYKRCQDCGKHFA